MEEGYIVKMDNSPLANILISKNRKNYRIYASVCPKCGKVDFYIKTDKELPSSRVLWEVFKDK